MRFVRTSPESMSFRLRTLFPSSKSFKHDEYLKRISFTASHYFSNNPGYHVLMRFHMGVENKKDSIEIVPTLLEGNCFRLHNSDVPYYPPYQIKNRLNKGFSEFKRFLLFHDFGWIKMICIIFISSIYLKLLFSLIGFAF